MVENLKQQRANLTARRDAVEAELAEVRESSQDAAYQAELDSNNKVAKKRFADLCERERDLEAEGKRIAAASIRVEAMLAEERRVAEEVARQKEAEERKVKLQQASQAMKKTVEVAAEIDKLINALGEAYQSYREEFAASGGAIGSLVGNPTSLAEVGHQGLRMEIHDRLVAVGIIEDHSLTSAQREATVSGVAQTYAFPFINAASSQLQQESEELQ